jgi:hypothetical protein
MLNLPLDPKKGKLLNSEYKIAMARLRFSLKIYISSVEQLTNAMQRLTTSTSTMRMEAESQREPINQLHDFRTRLFRQFIGTKTHP